MPACLPACPPVCPSVSPSMCLFVYLSGYDELSITSLQRYPDCICQAVYHTFFIAYPTSYQQFGEDFKQGLCNFVYLWLTGLLPLTLHTISNCKQL
jgi:hypothetical protein